MLCFCATPRRRQTSFLVSRTLRVYGRSWRPETRIAVGKFLKHVGHLRTNGVEVALRASISLARDLLHPIGARLAFSVPQRTPPCQKVVVLPQSTHGHKSKKSGRWHPHVHLIDDPRRIRFDFFVRGSEGLKRLDKFFLA